MNILVCIHSPFAMWNIPDAHVDRLRRAFPSHTFLHARDDDEAVRLIGDAEVAFSSHVTREQRVAARKLRWIHSPAAGVGGMMYPEMVDGPIVISNSRGISAATIAEHIVAVTLAMFRHLPFAIRGQAERAWVQDEIGAAGNRQIAGSHVVIVGYGAIGRAAGQLMTALGARVTGVRRNVTQEGDESGREQVVTAEALHDVLPSADVVVVAAPHTRDTRGLIGPRELGLMRRHAILVNVSRGQLIDEAALIDALSARRIAGAALDVFVDEPLSPDSPFWTLANVLVTPHTSGWRLDHWDAATDLFADNLRRYEAGESLINVVDKRAGY